MKKLVASIIIFVFIVLLLFKFNILWKSPSHFKLEKEFVLETPIMDMETYMNELVNIHRRPYIYEVKSKSKGKAIIVGVSHLNDPTHSQFDSIRYYWNLHKPTVALVEGRMGFFMKGVQDPIPEYGESGLTSLLAKENDADLYTWEPTRENEIEALIKIYPAKKLAMFYSLRPFFGIPLEERKDSPEKKLQKLINERTDYEYLKNSITNWEEIDSIWKKDFHDSDWRNHDSGYGFPGYLHDIWNNSNLYRDEHMVKIILELINNGETVFITMGSSHAPRIENTLLTALMN